jgi:phospholipid/cholesterol/gamma-HCH transport system substrate-binding protein
MKQNSFRAGLFVLMAILLFFYMILKVGEGGLFRSGDYTLYMDVPSAVGLDRNTPVQIAGVDIGTIDDVSLTSDNLARLKISIRHDVRIAVSARGVIKQTGILGDSFVDIEPGFAGDPPLKNGDLMAQASRQGDFSSLTGQFSIIADDVKAITKQMRKLMAGDDSSLSVTMKNIEKITGELATVADKNQGDISAIVSNMKALTQNLNTMVANNLGNVNGTLDNINGITATINSGHGTIGRLVKDEDTVEKLNDALDGVNDFVGGANRMKVEMGAHSEYLGGTGHFKNYVGLNLEPRPDKAFRFEVSADPDPSFVTTKEITEVTSGGTTNTIEVQRRSKALSKFQFSAQLAKKFENLTLRGGLIESSGGVGLDYNYGPFGMEFSAFDFKTDFGEKPHLKAMGTAQVTKTFYLLTGLDDPLNPNQDLDWFMGAGIRFTDDDIKSLLGVFSSMKR